MCMRYVAFVACFLSRGCVLDHPWNHFGLTDTRERKNRPVCAKPEPSSCACVARVPVFHQVDFAPSRREIVMRSRLVCTCGFSQ